MSIRNLDLGEQEEEILVIPVKVPEKEPIPA